MKTPQSKRKALMRMNLMSEILALAEEHAARLVEDIPLSRTRDEHIRVTARANEAARLVDLLTTHNADTQRSE